MNMVRPAIDVAGLCAAWPETEEEPGIAIDLHPNPPEKTMDTNPFPPSYRQHELYFRSWNRDQKLPVTAISISRGHSMTGKNYVKLLKQLGLTAYGGAAALGISPRMSMRYAAGTHPIPETVAKLLRALVKLGTADV